MLLNLQESVRGICRCYLQHFLQHKTLLFCTVNSDGATSNFIAIQHKVIVLATDLQRDRDRHLGEAGPQLHLKTTCTEMANVADTGNEATELCKTALSGVHCNSGSSPAGGMGCP